MPDPPLYLLERSYSPGEPTLGQIYGPQGGLVAKTQELPRLEGTHSISCVREGKYRISRPSDFDKLGIKIVEMRGEFPNDFVLLVEEK